MPEGVNCKTLENSCMTKTFQYESIKDCKINLCNNEITSATPRPTKISKVEKEYIDNYWANAIGRGKGKGGCWSCGGPYKQWQCPVTGKGKEGAGQPIGVPGGVPPKGKGKGNWGRCREMEIKMLELWEKVDMLKGTFVTEDNIQHIT